MEFTTNFNVTSRNDQTVKSNLEDDEISIRHTVYDVKCETCDGQAFGHYLEYALDQNEEGTIPMMIRGFLRFKGVINGYEGSFLAYEDGARHPGGLTMGGRLVDATGDLVTGTGRYEYEQVGPDQFAVHFSLEF